MFQSKEQRLLKVLEWLYVSDNTFKNKNEWREALIKQLYYLADVEVKND